jgi:serine/threonine-protein kinase RsbW
MFQQESLTVKSDVDDLNEVLLWFEQFCQKHFSELSWLADTDTSDTPDNTLHDTPDGTLRERQSLALDLIKIALDEGFTNAVRYAHKDLPLETPIDIELTLWDKRLEIRIWDHGEPFDPDTLEEPTPGKLQVGGYGWFLMRRLTDRVVYERCADGRNCLLLVKHKAE